ncbi:tyrosine-protein phosphatase siw14 [Penicillium ochrochloron]
MANEKPPSQEHPGKEEPGQEGDLPQQLVIPERFAQVVKGVYRSSFPEAVHLTVLEIVGVKTILRFVEEQYCQAVQQFCAMNNIRCVSIPVVPNKEGTVKTPDETVNTIMDALMDKRNHPILVHCNQGKHRTGCMIACFRKLQGWGRHTVINEYRSFAWKKARPLDEAFFAAYSPSRSIREKAKRLNIAAWVTVPDRLTNSKASNERPKLSRNEPKPLLRKTA